MIDLLNKSIQQLREVNSVLELCEKLLKKDGTVGELISDYDPDYLELIVEGGVSHSVFGFTEVRKLKRLSSKRSMPVPAYSY